MATEADGTEAVKWKRLIAVGLVADDLSIPGIARYAGVHAAEAAEAMTAARAWGIVGPDGDIDPEHRARLVADLAPQAVAEVHAAAARHLFAGGPDRFGEAVGHARAAGTMVDPSEIVVMATQGGRMSLSLGEYAVAQELLTLAEEFDFSAGHADQARLLIDIAAASDGLGDVEEARRRLAHAVSLAELADDAALAAKAAVQHALPVDWYAGDTRSVALLHQAEAMDLDADDRVAVLGARALSEMRIPVGVEDGQQFAWVTRPVLAQSLADEALAASVGASAHARQIALLAWRGTHRAPEFLARRREVSSEALSIAQQLRNASNQVEAAIWLAVDAIESGDRPLFDEALAVARWVAERDGNPRLLWRVYTLTTGAAHLDGDLDAAAQFAKRARQVGEPIKSPGWLPADLFFLGQRLIDSGDVDSMLPFLDFDEASVPAMNPLGKSALAYLSARVGDVARAKRLTRSALRQVDPESSAMLVLTRISDVALLLDDHALMGELLGHLSPLIGHVSTDSNVWWCDGPVGLWVAMLEHALGRADDAREHLDEAEPVLRAINDVRGLRRATVLRASFGGSNPEAARTPSVRPLRLVNGNSGLTERELEVLALLAIGATNPQIAQRLCYSVSTIRNDTMAIYRKLGVSGRPEAATRAAELGLLDAERGRVGSVGS